VYLQNVTQARVLSVGVIADSCLGYNLVFSVPSSVLNVSSVVHLSPLSHVRLRQSRGIGI